MVRAAGGSIMGRVSLEGGWPRGGEQWRRLMITTPAIPGHK